MSTETIVAYGCALIAVLFFGSNFVPVKKYETSDGVFFQFVMCLGIFVTGSVVNAVRDFPDFQPLAMLGGFLWCTGNMLSVPVIKLIGLSLGLLIWGTTNMLMGWSSGTFGFFGLDKHTPDDVPLNYAGVAVAVISLSLYTLIKPNAGRKIDGDEVGESSAGVEGGLKAPILRRNGNSNPDLNRMFNHYVQDDHASLSGATPRLLGVDPYMKKSTSVGNRLSTLGAEPTKLTTLEEELAEEGESFIDALPRHQKRYLGVAMAIVAGIFFGTNFDPPQYLMDHGHTQQALDYVYSHFCGIFLTSTIYFLIYCYAKKEPIINKELILPAFVSGVMWAIADTAWFYANSKLSMQVAFPIITSGPGFVAAMWGMCVFGENQGRRNQIVIACAFVLTVASDVMIGLSSPP